MGLIVGLGNPGTRYEDTRHNAGFWFADRLARAQHASWRLEGRFFGQLAELAVSDAKLRLLKPMTFMNESGRAVGAVARYFDIMPERILVAHDDIDLPPGTVRLKRGGGHGGHNGLRDIIPQLGDASFARLRIGIGHPGTKEHVTGYVLSRPDAEDRLRIEEALTRSAGHFDAIAMGRFQQVMNDLHRRPSTEAQEPR